MKNLISLIFVFASFSAQATPWQPPTFERQKLTFKVERSELSFKNGQYSVDVKTLCSGTADFNVDDLRNIPPGSEIMQNQNILCKAVVDGREREFYINYGSTVYLSDSRPVKAYFFSLWNRPTDNLPDQTPQATPNSASTRQLDLRSLLLFSSPGQGVTCLSSEGTFRSFKASDLRTSDVPDNCEIINPVIYLASGEFETL